MRVLVVRFVGVALVVALAASFAGCTFHPADGSCRDGETRPCYSGSPATDGVGACSRGLESCSNGRWQGLCIGDRIPFVENCNAIDDDCNGVIDDVEGTGESCNAADNCLGQTACVADKLKCVPLPENACGLCGGPEVAGLGDRCTVAGCEGATVCTQEGTGTECDAPAPNECGVCGGPSVTDLGTVCLATAGCAGQRACNMSGTSSFCDCSVNICNDNGFMRPVRTPQTGDLVITEVMPSPSKVSDTVGEWFEVKALVDVDLNNLLLDRAGDTANPSAINAYDCMPLAAGNIAVFAKNADPAVNGGVTGVAATFSFALVSGSVAAPADVRILAGTTIVDSITWTSSRTGKALQLDPDATDSVSNDQATNFCDATATYGLGDFGTPGTANAQCAAALPPGQCIDNGVPRAIVKPGATDLVITEVMANPKVEPAQEWFEITNVGSVAFDLNGLGLDRAGDSSPPAVVGDTTCRPLAPTAFALFARSTDPAANGMLPAPDATFSFALPNPGGDIRVVDASSCTGTACTLIYDAIAYTSSTDGISSQVMPGSFTTTDNDDPANYCPAISPYGDSTNLGTPRAPNGCN